MVELEARVEQREGLRLHAFPAMVGVSSGRDMAGDVHWAGALKGGMGGVVGVEEGHRLGGGHINRVWTLLRSTDYLPTTHYPADAH